MSRNIGDLPIGAKIKDVGTTYYGETIVWLLGDKNHPGYPSNSAALVTEKIIKIMAFDGKEPNSGSNLKHYGNNNYILSNIRQWMNKAGSPWFAAMGNGDAPPNSANVSSNPYDTENGFLSNFSIQFKNALLRTALPMKDGSTVTDQVFLLSHAETGSDDPDGTRWPFFSASSNRPTKPTAGAASHSSGGINADANLPWFTRTPSRFLYNEHQVVSVSNSEDLNFFKLSDPYESICGLRPGICVPLTLAVSDSPDSSGAYIVQWNRAPSKPPSITVPATIRIHKAVTVSWTAGVDPDGDTISYELQRSVNGGAYGNIYTGSALSYSETAAVWNTVQHRVRTKDGRGAYSDYTSGPQRSIIHNVDPTVSGTDTNLGAVKAPPSFAYQVGDADAGDTLTVTEKLDGATIRTIASAVRGMQYSFTLTKAQFFALASGPHKLAISVSDGQGNSATRTVSFTRSVGAIDFDAKLTTDAMAKRVLATLRYIAEDGDVTLKVCNNANDASPAWEDARPGAKHIFQNSAKTAAAWAIGVRVYIAKSAAFPQPVCYPPSVAYL